MIALLAVELRRILARRFLHLIVLAAIAGGAIGGLISFLRSNVTFSVADISGTLGGTTVPFVLVSWLLGASFIGAEWRAGTMTTHLTWEPRRIRVLVSKALAAAITAAALTFLLQVAIGAMLLPSALKHGSIGLSAATLHDVGGIVGRGAALAAISSVIGFAIGSLGRNTAFAIGVGFVYLAILEGGLLGSTFPGMRRWLLVGNAIVFVSGQEQSDIVGRSVIGAGLLLSLYAAGALAVAAAVFRARDVT